jgi:hypothetical protein
VAEAGDWAVAGAVAVGVALAGPPPATAPPPLQAATTHAAAASEVPRMIASQRWRTPAAVPSAPVIRAAASRDPTKLLLPAFDKFLNVSWHDG